MDPRRARDPRLARQDPRLQQRSHSGTPSAQPPQGPPHQGYQYQEHISRIPDRHPGPVPRTRRV
ncbi:hypothetical protein GY45DRAFT_1053410 [Cubamyces sp. BRFM 1775]|nr:hypothetical protein GY45DRAFT_1053410 [Cubamyces sp. BRFM 1775]